MIIVYLRYIGIPIIFVVSGYFYLLLKDERRFEETFLLMSMAAMAPLLFNANYMKWFIATFFAPFIGIGLINLLKIRMEILKRYTKPFLIILLVFSIVFTSYFQFVHFLNEPPSRQDRYMPEKVYKLGLWIKDSANGKVYGGFAVRDRLLAVSGETVMTGFGPVDLSYGFIDPEKIRVEKIYNFTQIEFYSRDPYKISDDYNPQWYAKNLLRTTHAQGLIQKYNMRYYVKNTADWVQIDGMFDISDNIYDDGQLSVRFIGKEWYKQ
jgi:hypothetical protein